MKQQGAAGQVVSVTVVSRQIWFGHRKRGNAGSALVSSTGCGGRRGARTEKTIGVFRYRCLVSSFVSSVEKGSCSSWLSQKARTPERWLPVQKTATCSIHVFLRGANYSNSINYHPTDSAPPPRDGERVFRPTKSQPNSWSFG